MTQRMAIYAQLVNGAMTVKQLQSALGISQEGTVRRELKVLREQGVVIRRANLWSRVSTAEQEVTAPNPNAEQAPEPGNMGTL